MTRRFPARVTTHTDGTIRCPGCATHNPNHTGTLRPHLPHQPQLQARYAYALVHAQICPHLRRLNHALTTWQATP